MEGDGDRKESAPHPLAFLLNPYRTGGEPIERLSPSFLFALPP